MCAHAWAWRWWRRWRPYACKFRRRLLPSQSSAQPASVEVGDGRLIPHLDRHREPYLVPHGVLRLLQEEAKALVAALAKRGDVKWLETVQCKRADEGEVYAESSV
eukprot:1619454-Pleurochrysis_carterae.AAC.1